MNLIHIQRARPEDEADIIQFNAAMALETEGKELLPDRISAGVRSLIEHPDKGFYLVAKQDNRVVGSLLITFEWSDWRNGLFWWIQSVYVRPENRGKGVYRALYRHVQEMANTDPGVCGFRLYVEQDNTKAQSTYQSLGMSKTHYQIYEELKPGFDFFKSPQF
jgi:ribosomal protein S18 acetylase RimI-like enzyme